MNGKELNKINNFIINFLKKKLGNNLFGIISDGSVGFGDFQNNWSDIDLVLIVDKNNLEIKQRIAEVKIFLEKKYKKHFGINVILIQEFKKPINSVITLDGKTLQALVELKKYPDRLLFCKNKRIKFYIPNKKEIKKYSLSNIAMFLLRGRRDLTTNYLRNVSDYKQITKKEIRESFIIVKLAVQYFSLYICKNKRDVIKNARKIFSDFNFEILQSNLLSIEKWTKIKSKKELSIILKNTDYFIESFCKYIFNKTKKAEI